MLIRRPPDIKSSEITDEAVYLDRRRFLRAAGFAALGAAAAVSSRTTRAAQADHREIAGLRKSPLSIDEPPNSWEDITTYNNFYEFGTDKSDPHRRARDFEPRPWEVTVSGECDRPGTLSYEDFVAPHTPEERIYRLRCVEAWSMVIPWVGLPMADVLKRFEPNSRAKFVTFRTLHDPERMPGRA